MNFKKILAIIIISVLILLGLSIPIASSVCYNNTVEVNAVIIVEPEEKENVITDEKIAESELEEDINQLPITIVYTTTKVRLRAGPSTDTEIINTLKINTQLNKIGEDGDWSIIKVDNNKYYIYSKYISTEKTIIKTTSRASIQDRIETQTYDAIEQASRQFFRLLYFNLLLFMFKMLWFLY